MNESIQDYGIIFKMNKRELHKEMLELKRSLNFELSVCHLLYSQTGKRSDQEQKSIISKREYALNRIPEILEQLKRG